MKKLYTLFCGNIARCNVIVCGLLFFFLFSAFGPSQNLQSTVHGKLGFWTISALYLAYAPANLLSPGIVITLGERKSLALGASTYIVWLVSNIFNIDWLMYIGACANGLGAAILWTAQGSYLTRNSTKFTIGSNSGLFQAIYQLSQIVGNLIAGLIIQSDLSPAVLFLCLTLIGSISFAIMFLLRDPPDLGPDALASTKGPIKPLLQRFLDVIKIYKELKFLFLAPLPLFTGICQAFYTGQFPKEIGIQYIGFTMACFGGAAAAGCVVIGKFIDKYGRKPALFIGLGMLVIPVCVFTFAPTAWLKAHFYVYFILAIFFGFSNACFLTVSNSMVGMVFSNRVENGQGALRLISAMSVALNFFFGPFLGVAHVLAMLSGASVIAVGSAVICDMWIAKIDEPEPKTSEEVVSLIDDKQHEDSPA